MSLLNVSGCGRDNGSPAGQTCKDVHIDGSARAHLRDTYHLGKSMPKECSRSRMLSRSLGLDNPLHRLPYAVEALFDENHRSNSDICAA
jgi:hypothetical protein